MWDFKKAVASIENGEIICFKTDTVPGISCDPFNQKAVNKIYALKQREAIKPLVIMVADIVQLSSLVEDVPPAVISILEKYWPGNLTVIFKQHKNLSQLFGSDKIGIRIPAKKQLRELIRSIDRGLAVTSANLSGQKELLTIKNIEQEFGDKISLYIDDEDIQSGIASTIIDVSSGEIEVLRGEFNE